MADSKNQSEQSETADAAMATATAAIGVMRRVSKQAESAPESADVVTAKTTIGWMRRASKQVENAEMAIKKDECQSEQSENADAAPAATAIGWIRRASKQVENAGMAFKKLGLKVKMVNKLGGNKKKKNENLDEVPRYYTFDPNAIQRGASLCDLFENDEVEEDFNEIVDMDDERVEEVVSQELVGRMVDSMWFRGLILGVIIVNAILIGAQTNKDLSQEYAWLFFVFDHTVLSIFVAELCLKWYNGFSIYWKVGWNWLDFCIIVVLLLGPALTFLGSSRILRILRVLRAFRGLRNVSALTGLSVVVQTVFQSIPDMTNIALLLVIIMVVLSVVGVLLFGEDFPGNFGNLQSAMFSIFICVTQDGWVDLYDQMKSTPHWSMGAIYFMLAIVVGAFVFANLVVAVVVTNLDKAMNEAKREDKARQDVLGTTNDTSDGDNPELNKEVPIASIEEVKKRMQLNTQKPLYFANFENVTTESFAHYAVLITALEENLAEYVTIKTDLDKIFRLIRELNEDDEEEDEVVISSEEIKSKDSIDFKNIGRKGDILSNLLELEQHKVISTRRGSLAGAIKDAAVRMTGGRRLSKDLKRKNVVSPDPEYSDTRRNSLQAARTRLQSVKAFAESAGSGSSMSDSASSSEMAKEVKIVIERDDEDGDDGEGEPLTVSSDASSSHSSTVRSPPQRRRPSEIQDQGGTILEEKEESDSQQEDAANVKTIRVKSAKLTDNENDSSKDKT